MNDSKSDDGLPEEKLDLAYDEHPETVQDFFECLRGMRLELGIGGFPYATTLFRGQRDSTWGLLPGICRTGWIESMRKHIPFTFRPDRLAQDFKRNMWELAAIEHAAVLTFIHFADATGIRLPGYTPDMQKKMFVRMETAQLAACSDKSPDGWTDNIVGVHAYDALIALAQHYEIPTRFLDFSFSPYIAAYFAATTALMKDDGSKKDIAVWGVSTGFNSDFIEALGWRLVQVPYQDNARMRVQQAAFITVNYPQLENLNESRGLDTLAMEAHWSRDMLGRVTLPFKAVFELIRELDDLGISDRTMLLGYEGVVDYMKTTARIGTHFEEMTEAAKKRGREIQRKMDSE